MQRASARSRIERSEIRGQPGRMKCPVLNEEAGNQTAEFFDSIDPRSGHGTRLKSRSLAAAPAVLIYLNDEAEQPR